MKRINLLFLFGLLSILTFNFSACSDDDENASSSGDIVGTWILISTEGWIKENGKIIDEWNIPEDESLYYTFHSDGTLEFIDPTDDYEVVETGTWRCEKDKIHLCANGENLVVTLMSVNKTEMVVGIHEKEVEDGITYEYYEAERYQKISD